MFRISLKGAHWLQKGHGMESARRSGREGYLAVLPNQGTPYCTIVIPTSGKFRSYFHHGQELAYTQTARLGFRYGRLECFDNSIGGRKGFANLSRCLWTRDANF